jgi:transposase
MQPTVAQNVGVDISKDFLDVAIHPAGQAIRFANDGKGHRALIKRLAPVQVMRVVFEATGAYHRRNAGARRSRPGPSRKPIRPSPHP